MIRRLFVATVACAAAVVTTVPVVQRPAPVAAAQPRNRAAVVVDTGREVRRVCVRFDEDTLSGAEILRRAGVEPVFSSYGSMGEAVCSLCGVGCPGDDCFCDRSRYWAYSRAEDGRTTFTRSSVGASSTKVGDGDVEGWRWGTGAAPPFASVEMVCGEVAAESAPPRATTTTTSGNAAGARSPTTTAAHSSAPPSSEPSAAHRPPSSIAGAEPVTEPGEVTIAEEQPAGDPAVAATEEPARPASTRPRPSAAAEPASSAPAIVAFGAVLAGLATWWLRLRRRRSM